MSELTEHPQPIAVVPTKALASIAPPRVEAPVGRSKWSGSRVGLLFASPWIIGFGIFYLLPLLMSVVLTFAKWDGLSVRDAEWVGLQNWRRALLADPLVWKALYNTLYYVVLVVPAHLAISLGLALLLNRSVAGTAIFRTIFYLPAFVAGVATAVLWQWMLNPEIGLINGVLRNLYGLIGLVGVDTSGWPLPGWLQDPAWSKFSLVLMATWSGGGAMLIFLAALQNAPKSLYEAAAIDGAGSLKQFRHVTLPMLSPIILFNAVVGLIGSFQVFTEAYVMTRGGPDKSTLFFMLYVFYTAFEDFQFGYGATLSWLLFVVIVAVSGLLFLSARKWVHYS